MKHLRLFIFIALIFSSITAIAKDCPYLRQDKIYNCSLIITGGKKSSYDAAIVMTQTSGKQQILIKGYNEDENINFVITLKGDLKTKIDDDGEISYAGFDDNGNAFIIGSWTEGRRLILFDFEGIKIGVVFDKYPFEDLNS